MFYGLCKNLILRNFSSRRRRARPDNGPGSGANVPQPGLGIVHRAKRGLITRPETPLRIRFPAALAFRWMPGLFPEERLRLGRPEARQRCSLLRSTDSASISRDRTLSSIDNCSFLGAALRSLTVDSATSSQGILGCRGVETGPELWQAEQCDKRERGRRVAEARERRSLCAGSAGSVRAMARRRAPSHPVSNRTFWRAWRSEPEQESCH